MTPDAELKSKGKTPAGLAVERRSKALGRKRKSSRQECDVQEVEAGRHLEFAASQGYIVRPYLKTIQRYWS